MMSVIDNNFAALVSTLDGKSSVSASELIKSFDYRLGGCSVKVSTRRCDQGITYVVCTGNSKLNSSDLLP